MPPTFFFQYAMYDHLNNYVGPIESEGQVQEGDWLNYYGTLFQAIEVNEDLSILFVERIGSLATIKRMEGN